MPTTKAEDRDLLEYNPKHSVLICRECQYAIQKNALESHLLRHKIYRSERQRLIASVSQLTILEPDDVLLPTADSPPVEGISILAGYRCTSSDCQHLTVSEKRMKRHWSETHGSDKIIPKLSTFAVAVSLQTFFRGTKVKYFEVTPLTSPSAESLEDGTDKDVSMSDHDGSQDGDEATGLHLAEITTPPTPVSVPMFESRMPNGLGSDMEILKYFHHFTTATCLTLPSMEGVDVVDTYWQVDVVAQALSHRWLMYGVLALAASHLSCLTDDAAAKQTHRQIAAHFLYDFYPGLEKESGLGKASASEAGNTLLEMASDCDEKRTPQNSGMPTAMANALRTLPFRLAGCTNRPDDPQDVVASMTAIANLFESCELSFGQDDMKVSWQSMAGWLLKISQHFEQMTVRSDPVALVVVAYWTILLVTRAQQLGCWFLTGVAEAILRQISGQLSANNQPALALIEDLIREKHT
ncbi:hypothetical protein D6D12_00580 [Aureobasidium pullulans]|uniref:C2H2-type domain-containing protein n=1 Tax=Aureobasidium pullulans TaxID=5580 RepID=A0AB74K5X6_AURPU|nr:hypothetical protein D6D12_00580 [Aureobasidium pullulans]